ncbi:hypothetical protein [Bacillus sp. FJAT-45350]|uniref:hypothetical protein n=1 Tax=Bacillus sp. FJAT-45350 TaxID=2011014 RepID=UPI0015CD0F91|nr:hypothetical protein [Bacillus sp. FJAT-45350]
MLMPSKESGAKVFNMVWENTENGMESFFSFHKELGRLSLETVEKQREMWDSSFVKLSNFEQEVEKVTKEMMFSLKENADESSTEAFGTWFEKVNEIIGRMKDIRETPSKAMSKVLEDSHQRLYEAEKKLIEEQGKIQKDTKERLENLLVQVKESQKQMIDKLAL